MGQHHPDRHLLLPALLLMHLQQYWLVLEQTAGLVAYHLLHHLLMPPQLQLYAMLLCLFLCHLLHHFLLPPQRLLHPLLLYLLLLHLFLLEGLLLHHLLLPYLLLHH
jgi:hypothetical protein